MIIYLMKYQFSGYISLKAIKVYLRLERLLKIYYLSKWIRFRIIRFSLQWCVKRRYQPILYRKMIVNVWNKIYKINSDYFFSLIKGCI